MAKSNNNVITHGLSEKIGDLLVFSQRGGKTIVSIVPQKKAPASEKQLAQRQRFQQAIIYGKAATATPGTGELYAAAAKKQKGKTPINVAVADFFGAPDIEQVDLSGYAGGAGDRILVQASDDFAVKAVHVRISNADGSLVEEGAAVQSVGNLWTYTATQTNESLEGDKIVISASDLPGNMTEKGYDL
jgi:hypothetical protein